MSPPSNFPNQYKADIDEVLEAIFYLYTESRRVTKEMARRVQVTGPQLTIVKLLETFGDLTLSDLSERIRARNSTVTGIIDRMERDGLVQRTRSPGDRRVFLIQLTPEGLKLARAVPVEPMDILRKAIGALSAAETRELLRILGKLAAKVRTIVRENVDKETES